MRIVNLIENTPGAKGCAYEHGLSFYIETEKHKIIVDTGASGAFVDNAAVLSVDLTQVDLLFLSHGHYDHSGGIVRFAGINPNAKIIMQESALLGYYHLYPNEAKYIGVDKAQIMSLPGLELINGNVKIDDELSIFTGVTGRKLWPKGNRELVMATDVDWVQDEFRHEQYLVINCEGRKILVSGCAHNGILNILDEYERLYGGAPDVVISGFHMMQKSGYDEEDIKTIKGIAYVLNDTPTIYYTGHCTGEEPFNIMKKIMGDKLTWVHSGEELIEWFSVRSDADIKHINEIYNNFEDAVLVKMEFVSGDYVDNDMTSYIIQNNDLKVLFQRLDRNPFSIELWFKNTKRMNMFFADPKEHLLSDIMYAKVCKNEKSVFWTVWEEFDPNNEEHLSFNDVYYIEACEMKWRIVEM